MLKRTTKVIGDITKSPVTKYYIKRWFYAFSIGTATLGIVSTIRRAEKNEADYTILRSVQKAEKTIKELDPESFPLLSDLLGPKKNK